MVRNYDVIALLQNSFDLRRPSVAIFADIIKIVTIFTNIILKDKKNLKD